MTNEGLVKHNICLYLDTLKRRGILDFWLNHTTGQWDARQGTFRRRNSRWDRNGIADICGFFRGGRGLYIEVKAGSNNLSDNQRAFKADCDLWGAFYLVAWSVEDVKTALNHYTKT